MRSHAVTVFSLSFLSAHGVSLLEFTLRLYVYPYLTLPYLTLRYLTLRYLTLPYLTLPYLTLCYLTLPYHTLPYPIIPYSGQGILTNLEPHPRSIRNTGFSWLDNIRKQWASRWQTTAHHRNGTPPKSSIGNASSINSEHWFIGTASSINSEHWFLMVW